MLHSIPSHAFYATAEMVNMFAQNEQNMNAVERILVYTQLPTEGQQEESEHPDNTWPDHGQITFTDVDLTYREGLPPVLKDVNFQIKPGEKVRHAVLLILYLLLSYRRSELLEEPELGKVLCFKLCSGMHELGRVSVSPSFVHRIVDVQKGRIDIDGIDISKLRLDTLRNCLALVPQDTTMFLGTLRDNL